MTATDATTPRQWSLPPASGAAAGFVAATAVTALVAAAVATTAAPGPLALAFAAACIGLVGAVLAPRPVLVVTLFVLCSYAADAIGGGPVSAATTMLPFALAFAVAVRHFLRVERIARPPREAGWFAGYVVALAFTLLFARDRSAGVGDIIDTVGFGVLAWSVLVLVDRAVWLRRCVFAVVAALGLLAVLAVAQQVTRSYGRTLGGLVTVTHDLGTMRSNGPLSANYFAEVLAGAVPLAAYLAVLARRRAARAAYVGCALCMLAAIVYTLSRGALVALVVAAVAVVALHRVPLRVIAGGAVAVLVVGTLALPASVRGRIGELGGLASGAQASDSSLRGRLGENLAAIDMFVDHPVVGVGPGNFEDEYPAYAQRIGLDPRPEVRGAHSLYLESLAQTGLVGSVVLFGLLGAALTRAARRRRSEPDRDTRMLVEATFVALVSFLACAVTLHLSYPRYLWTFVALTFAAGALRSEAAV